MENQNEHFAEPQEQQQYVPMAAHRALIAELVEQRDKALADCANKGMENRMLRAQLDIEQSEGDEVEAEPPAETSDS